jgi:hypothetical protein
VTSYRCRSKHGRRGHKTGPGRGAHHGESIEDRPPRLTNAAIHEAGKRDDKKADEHPMSHRLKRRQTRHLKSFSRHALGPEHSKVMGSMHPGKHRVGKVKSM